MGANRKKRTPRPHQQEAIRSVVAGLKGQDRGQLLMACGTGKTLTAFWIREALNAGRTLVLLPSLNLVAQTLKEWAAESGGAMDWICVCSDSTVAKAEDDEWVVNTSDLGIPVTSDPSSIKDFLQHSPAGVVFSTYQSSPLVADAQKDPGVPPFDLAIADEAHRCAGKVSTAFACVLDEAQIRASKRLFMTATPRVLGHKGKKKASDENLEVACMDDTSIFGEVLHQLSFSEAISRDLLTDYKVIIIGVDDPSIQASIVNRAALLSGSGRLVECAELANHVALAKAVADYSLQRVITYHGRVGSAHDFSTLHQSVVKYLPLNPDRPKTVKTGFVYGDMDAQRRGKEIDLLKNQDPDRVTILSNARCLSEGVDLPALDAVAFIDPRKSTTDIVQAVGRAIRKSPDKKCSYVILPVYLEKDDALEEEILASRFRDIWEVMLALKSQDDALSAALDHLRMQKGRTGTLSGASAALQKVVFDLDGLSHVPEAFAKSLRAMLVENTTNSWDEMYGRLLTYFDEHGTADVPWDATDELARWVSYQRRHRRDRKLNQRQIDLLDELGLTWDIYDDRWHLQYEECAHSIREGIEVDCQTPLGRWQHTQRHYFREGTLSPEREALLNEIGFVWEPVAYWFEQKCQALDEFVNENGHANVPSSHPVLGSWVGNQRVSYKAGTLPQDKIDRLEALGLAWNQREANWDEKLELLKTFVQENGHARVPASHPTLGIWVGLQRTTKRQGKLSAERTQRLEQVDGWVWDFSRGRQGS